MTFDSTVAPGEAFGPAEGQRDLALLRSRAHFGAATLCVLVLLLAAADPFIAPNAVVGLYLLKLPLLIAVVWVWRFVSHAGSEQALVTAIVATFVFTLLVSVPSSILVGSGADSMTIAGGMALGAAALLPLGVRAQVWLVLGTLTCALVPIAVVGVGMVMVFPLWAGLCSLAASIVIAQQNERHQLQTRRGLQSFGENLERLRLLTEHIQGVLWLNELDGALLYVSPRFQDIWGQSHSDLYAQPARWLDAVHPDDRSEVDSWFRTDAANRAGTCEYRLIRPDGFVRWIRDAAFPITGAHGGLWRIARLSLDVTADKEVAQANRMRELARNIQAAVEGERKRMARELHDELGQELTGIKLLLASVQKPLEKSHPEASNSIRTCANEIDKAMGAVRAMVHDLRPPVLDELGLLAALRNEAEEFAKRAGIHCDVDVPDVEPDLSEEQVTTVFRVAQESLTNVARHAHASRVRLRFGVTGDRLQLSVEDDGQGIAAAREDFGLRGMRERAALVNGSLDVQSRLEGGTLIRLQIPRASTPARASAL